MKINVCHCIFWCDVVSVSDIDDDELDKLLDGEMIYFYYDIINGI